jgi:hypothetical protein
MPCDLRSFRPNSVVSTNQSGEERHPGLPPNRQARSKAARGSKDHDVRRDFGIASCDPRRPRSSSSDCYRILSCLRLGSLRLSRAPGFRFNHAAEMSVARRSPVGCKSLAPGRAVSVDVCPTIWRLTIWRRAFDRHRPPAPDRGDSSVGRWLPGVRRHGGRHCKTTCLRFAMTDSILIAPSRCGRPSIPLRPHPTDAIVFHMARTSALERLRQSNL